MWGGSGTCHDTSAILYNFWGWSKQCRDPMCSVKYLSKSGNAVGECITCLIIFSLNSKGNLWTVSLIGICKFNARMHNVEVKYVWLKDKNMLFKINDLMNLTNQTNEWMTITTCNHKHWHLSLWVGWKLTMKLRFGQSEEEEAVALAEVAHFIGSRQIKITFTISLMILAIYLFCHVSNSFQRI